MALYKILEPAYVNERLYTEEEITKAKDSGGIVVDFTGEVRPGIDTAFELVDEPGNKKRADEEALVFQKIDRAAAIKAKLTDDGKPEGKLIDEKTPIDLVRFRLAIFKQSAT